MDKWNRNNFNRKNEFLESILYDKKEKINLDVYPLYLGNIIMYQRAVLIKSEDEEFQEERGLRFRDNQCPASLNF